MKPSIYLDHAATTPVDPRVFEVIVPYLRGEYGNPSSVHRLGRRVRVVIEECRERVAAAIGAEPAEIIFTSGGTEADNLAILGIEREGALVTSAAEHEAVLRAAESAQRRGRILRLLAPQRDGAVAVAQIEEAIDDGAALVSIMHANNEVGTLSVIEDIARVCRSRGVYLHTDAVQTMGVMEIDVDALGVDMLSASGHKLYGPKGAGFLYVRGGVELKPLITGGAQERSRRGGTENVAAIVGLAEAVRLAVDEREQRVAHLNALRNRLLEKIESLIGGEYRLNAPAEAGRGVPSIINLSFPPRDGRPIDGEMLLLNLDMEGVMASAGSACTSGAIEPSHVLTAMGIEPATAQASVRFSLGKDNTPEEMDEAAEVLARVIKRMRAAG